MRVWRSENESHENGLSGTRPSVNWTSENGLSENGPIQNEPSEKWARWNFSEKNHVGLTFIMIFVCMRSVQKNYFMPRTRNHVDSMKVALNSAEKEQ